MFAETTFETILTIPPILDNGDQSAGKYPSPLHHIHVRSVLTDQEVKQCLIHAVQYAATTGCWNQPDQERHATYSTCDFAVEKCDALCAYLETIRLKDRLWHFLSSLYNIDQQDMTYLDFFCARYQANSDVDDENTIVATTSTMDRLEAHRDGSLLSFTVTLSNPNDFEGGGTFFDALLSDTSDISSSPPSHVDNVLQPGGVVRPIRAGDVVLHSGKLLHGANVVKNGERIVLVGFVDVSEYCQRPGVLSLACRDWGRMDVAMYRYNRQQKMTQNGRRNGWFLRNDRWLPQGKSCSYIRGFCPVFPSVKLRAKSNFQRRKKLEAEDRLLRSILLSEDERKDRARFDYTVL